MGELTFLGWPDGGVLCGELVNAEMRRRTRQTCLSGSVALCGLYSGSSVQQKTRNVFGRNLSGSKRGTETRFQIHFGNSKSYPNMRSQIVWDSIKRFLNFVKTGDDADDCGEASVGCRQRGGRSDLDRGRKVSALFPARLPLVQHQRSNRSARELLRTLVVSHRLLLLAGHAYASLLVPTMHSHVYL